MTLRPLNLGEYWRASEAVLGLTCDTDGCQGAPDSVHWLPWVSKCERIVYACPKHDPGGYWTEVDGYGLPQERDFLHHVLETKGAKPVQMFAERFEAEREHRHQAVEVEMARRKEDEG